MKIRKRDQKREKSGGQKGKKRCKVGNGFMTIHHARGWTKRVRSARDPDEKLGCFGNQIYGPGVTYQRLIYYHLRLYINRSVITIDAPAWQLQQHFFFPSKESAGIFLEILLFATLYKTLLIVCWPLKIRPDSWWFSWTILYKNMIANLDSKCLQV